MGIVLSTDDARLGPRLRRLLPPAAYGATQMQRARDPGPLRRHHVAVRTVPDLRVETDGTLVERPPSEAALFEAVERQVDLLVAEHSPAHLALHAGVVSLGEDCTGGAILVAGTSGSGKSTLVEALVRAGGTYLSDDLALIDDRLRVHPYPRPLRRRIGGGLGTKDHRLDPHQAFGREPGAMPLPIRWIVLPTYREDARWRPSRLVGGAAVLALLEHTVSGRRAPDRALEILGRLVETARVEHGVRGDAADAADSILRRLPLGRAGAA